MEILKNNKCVKIQLKNGVVTDILAPVLNEICRWIQDEPDKPESGGYIVGYQHEKTGNISLEAVSHPYAFDCRSRVHFQLRDVQHQVFLRRKVRNKSYYMGVWHTHPQTVPLPSTEDIEDWIETLKVDKTGSPYVFFIIAGTKQWRIWVGDFLSKAVYECFECQTNSEGLYYR